MNDQRRPRDDDFVEQLRRHGELDEIEAKLSNGPLPGRLSELLERRERLLFEIAVWHDRFAVDDDRPGMTYIDRWQGSHPEDDRERRNA